MIRGDEIRKGSGQVHFALAALETRKLRLKKDVPAAGSAHSELSRTPNALNISGSQVLVECVSALCAVSLLLWTFLKLWLFEP